jgi:UDP-N-acetylglucosamine--N-acetylmuramyl-(pentapeptide) pyrophosphoryl-undecaprenol N-acetylglucosamine transferase
MSRRINIIITGGGTGGHVFPAIAIANALRERDRNINILFVGARGKMEMEQVPAAGYQIVGLPVKGFKRSPLLSNIPVLYYLTLSMGMAFRIIGKFRPHIVVGVGGYASGPVARAALMKKIPVLIQEQNSFAGVTNRLLARKAARICVAYEGMEAYFPAEKIMLTGNPVRKELTDLSGRREEAFSHFGLKGSRKVILIIGGSIGAGSINRAVTSSIGRLLESGNEFIWQTGRSDYREALRITDNSATIHVHEFISRMDLAYSAADLVISRAGAGTISELCITGKPALLVPSPNVAEDHQTKNAKALAEKDAAIMIKDDDVETQLADLAIDVAGDEKRLSLLKKNISALALHDSAGLIAEEVLKLAENKKNADRHPG